MTQKLVMCKGLPASGKSTFAKKLVEDDPSYVRINRDDLRHMVNGYQFSRSVENLITVFCDEMIAEALDQGFNVVVDETSLNPSVEHRLRGLVDGLVGIDGLDIEFEVNDSFLQVPLTECLFRNANRQVGCVPDSVIYNMHDKWIAPNLPVEG